MNRVPLLVAALMLSPTVGAAVPVLDYLYPAGGRRGSSVRVEAAGKLDPWPVRAWADCGQLHVEPGKTAGSLVIRIDDDAPVGPHLVRLYNGEGASALRCFMVGDQEEIAEADPNDELAKAQRVKSLPVTINGRLEKAGDVDRYAVQLEAGQTLVASLQGRRLGSPVDPMLHLEDPRGIELAFSHDGLGLDPLLAYRATRSGTHIVRVTAFAYPPAADVKLTGGKADVYRLNLTTGPFVRGAIPSGVTRGESATARLFGWNLDPRSDHVLIDASELAGDEDHLFVDVPGDEGRLRVESGDGPEWTREQYEAAGRLPIPVAITGVLDRAGQQQTFLFHAEKGLKLNVLLRPAAIGSPLAGTVRIHDAEGKTLARSDDSSLAVETNLAWTAPADGDFRVAVGDLYGKGGADSLYRLQITRPGLGARATVDTHEYRVAPGKTAAVKLTVVRAKGATGALRAVATRLPPGVTAAAVTIPETGGEVVVTLTAAPDAPPAGGPVKIVVSPADPSRGAGFSAVYASRQEKDGAQEMVEQTDAVWLTVLPAPATRAASRPATSPATRPARPKAPAAGG